MPDESYEVEKKKELASDPLPYRNGNVVPWAEFLTRLEVHDPNARTSYDLLPFLNQMAERTHNRRANVVFCDAHKEALTFKSLFSVTNDASLRRWNKDHEPHRE